MCSYKNGSGNDWDLNEVELTSNESLISIKASFDGTSQLFVYWSLLLVVPFD